MRNFIVDINKCQNFFDDKLDPVYAKMWRCSNEKIYDVLSTTNAKNKDILTVLSSGDQVFHFLNKDPRSIDAFDVNSLTFYYFYLRKWLICYLGYYYPPKRMDISFIRNILKVVSPKNSDEISAYYFWRNFSNRFSSKQLKSLFYVFDSLEDEIIDLSFVKYRLINDKINFYNIDLSSKVNIKKKYDIIYGSNIIDYVPKEKLFLLKNNLDSLLKKDGEFITTVINCKMLSNDVLDFLDESYELCDKRTTDRAVSYVLRKK